MNLKPEVVEQLERVLSAVEQLLPQAVEPIDWARTTAANWRRHSFAGYLEPIENIENTALEELVGIDRQKQILERNTCQFLRGFPANNALLWGSRGTGKSSLVRALLNKYAIEGLRIIQIDKHDLNFLSDIFAQIGKQPYRYIILCDDLSFEPDDPGYKILKSVLDGSVYASPKNVLIYVTSNRRHLLPEFHTDNLGAKMVHNEIHHGEAVEEKTAPSPFGQRRCCSAGTSRTRPESPCPDRPGAREARRLHRAARSSCGPTSTVRPMSMGAHRGSCRCRDQQTREAFPDRAR